MNALWSQATTALDTGLSDHKLTTGHIGLYCTHTVQGSECMRRSGSSGTVSKEIVVSHPLTSRANMLFERGVGVSVVNSETVVLRDPVE